MAAHKVEYLEKQINQNKSVSLINPKATASYPLEQISTLFLRATQLDQKGNELK